MRTAAFLCFTTVTLSGCFLLFGPADPGGRPLYRGAGGGTAGGDAFSTPDANFGGGVGGGECTTGSLSFGGSVDEGAMPPPISGGTLAVLSDGHTVVAADPDRDLVWIADTQTGVVNGVPLLAHDEPGRVLQDGNGRVHVVLRHAGAVVQLDPAAAAVVARRSVCSDARGIAWQSATDTLLVACATGELVTLPAGPGQLTQTQQLGGDLRDVIAADGSVFVTRFRTTEVLPLGASGPPMHAVSRSISTPPAPTTAVAWRTIHTPDGALLMSHQLETTVPVNVACSTAPGSSYGSGSASGGGGGSADPPPAIVANALTVFRNAVALPVNLFIPGVLPVDVAVSSDCTHVAVANAGSQEVIELTGLDGRCAYDLPGTPGRIPFPGATAVAYLPNGDLVIQLRQPAQLQVLRRSTMRIDSFTLGGAAAAQNTGHFLFHQDSSRGIACASCHPEGREDGLTWTFDRGTGATPRRTQSLSSGLLATAPFHWDGDMPGLEPLMLEVFVRRMGGSPPTAEQVQAVGRWLDSLPRPAAAPALDAAAVDRGRALFNDLSVGCSTCHNGTHLTNNTTVDVHTGGALQVPSLLGLAARAPYLHDGCARTLKDRFTPSCGGGDFHGRTSQLSSAQLDDLVAYLNAL